jgi:hypothetical protein
MTAFNAWSACYALTHILEGLYHSDPYDIAILDRGLFDALVWFELLASQRKISDEDRDRIQAFFIIDKWRDPIDLVFLFTADAATSLERETAEKLTLEAGRAMNPEFLGELNDAYTAVRDKFAQRFHNFQPIDTSTVQGSSPRATAYAVTQQIIRLLAPGVLE